MAVAVYHELAPVEHEWDELCSRAGAPPFLRPGWVGAWWRAFGEGTVEVLAVRENGRLTAVAPLSRCDGVLRSIADEHGIESGIVAENGAAARELSGALVERVEGRASLLFVDPTRTGLAELRDSAGARRCRALVRTATRSPYVAVGGDWPGYERRLGTKLLADLRRRRRRLEEQGAVSIELGDGGDRVDELLSEGFAVEASGWKGTAGTAIASDVATAGFYRETAQWARSRGWLHLAFLRLDGRAVAFEFAVRDGATHYRVKVGFDPAHREHAPGKLLLHRVLEDSFASGVTRFDFLGDDDAYKLEWSTGLRDLVLVQLFARDVTGSLAWATLALTPLAQRLRARLRR